MKLNTEPLWQGATPEYGGKQSGWRHVDASPSRSVTVNSKVEPRAAGGSRDVNGARGQTRGILKSSW